jgi:hypothetical protein
MNSANPSPPTPLPGVPGRGEEAESLRPRDLAMLLLASGDLLPRMRARDQQADRAGMKLKRQVLERIAALDPEGTELEAALMRIVEELSPPDGPVRAMAVLFHEEWQAACATPEWTTHLLAEALAAPPTPRRKDKTGG